jgi:hypothetical protein
MKEFLAIRRNWLFTNELRTERNFRTSLQSRLGSFSRLTNPCQVAFQKMGALFWSILRATWLRAQSRTSRSGIEQEVADRKV